MILNDAGIMVDRIWCEIPENYEGVGIDEHQVMPNHFHGIIILNNHNDGVGAIPRGRPDDNDTIPRGRPENTLAPIKRWSLGEVVGCFQSFTTHEYIQGVKDFNWERFNKKTDKI